MARLASNEKMGFYPTPHKTSKWIRNVFTINTDGEFYALDPCCGDGEALRDATPHYIQMFGIEIDPLRAMEASGKIKNVLQGSIFDAQIDPESFGVLYLNPPYDTEDGERVEMRFLKHSIRWLAPNGVLVFIVPEHILLNKTNRKWIGNHFHDIKVFRINKEDYPIFKQIVLLGYKRRKRVEDEEIPAPPYEHIEEVENISFFVPPTKGPKKFQMKETITPEEIEAYRPKLLRELEKIRGELREMKNIAPLFPLRKGHLVTLLTAGGLDGKLETPDGFLIIKGFSDRVTYTREEEDKTITTDTYSVCIRVIEKNKNSTRWYDIR